MWFFWFFYHVHGFLPRKSFFIHATLPRSGWLGPTRWEHVSEGYWSTLRWMWIQARLLSNCAGLSPIRISSYWMCFLHEHINSPFFLPRPSNTQTTPWIFFARRCAALTKAQLPFSSAWSANTSGVLRADFAPWRNILWDMMDNVLSG